MTAESVPPSIGAYEILSEVARGSTGIVYKARHRDLERVVALKVVNVANLAEPADAERFLRGARAAAKLDHPNLVRVFEVGRDGDRLFAAMTFVEGTTLRQRLRSGPLSTDEALGLVETLAEAVAHAHSRGVVHRDLNPDSVLFDARGTVRITGFGTARLSTRGQSLTAAGGDFAAETAPEFVTGAGGDSLRPTVDVYGLGTVLYAAIVGKGLFDDIAPGDLPTAIAEQAPLPRKTNPRIAKNLEALCQRCLAKSPEDRFPDATSLADFVKEIRSGSATRSGPVGAAVVPGVSAARRWRLGATLGAALVSLGLFFGFRLMGRNDPAASGDAPPLAIAPFDSDQARMHQEAWANHLGEPVEWENSIGMRFRLIPPGEFDMGATQEEADAMLLSAAQRRGTVSHQEKLAFTAATPRHRVRITRPFYCGVHEVTVGQFASFVRATKYETDADKQQQAWSLDTVSGGVRPGKEFRWNTPGYPQGDSHPVVLVTYHDAVAFCKWLSRAEGRTYRLLTEAEWEYCARSGSSSVALSESSISIVRGHANVPDDMLTSRLPYDVAANRAPWNDGHPFASPVGSFRPNAFGLHDFLGNVWELTSDWFDPSYYAASPLENPTGPQTGKLCVWRGGSHDQWAWLESFNPIVRVGDEGIHKRDVPIWVGGFRVMLDEFTEQSTGKRFDVQAVSAPAAHLKRAKALCDQAEQLPITEEIGGGWVVELWQQALAAAKEATLPDADPVVRRAETGLARAKAHLECVRREVPLWNAIQVADVAATAKIGSSGTFFDAATGAKALADAFRTFGYAPNDGSEAVLLRALEGRPARIREQILVGLQSWEVFADASGAPETAARLRLHQAAIDDDPWRGQARAARANPGAAGILPLANQIGKNVLLGESHDLIARVLLARGLMTRPESLTFFRESAKSHPTRFWPNYGLSTVLAEDAKKLTGESRLAQFDLALAALDAAQSRRPTAKALDPLRASIVQFVGTPKADREFARWVLNAGGRVNVRPLKDQPHKHFERVAMAETHLPSEPFRIIGFSLSNLPIGDAELESVPPLEFLEEAHLDGTNATDKGVRRLCQTHGSLSRINVEKTKVSDAIIDAFRDMKFVCVRNTAVTDAAAKNLVADGKGPEVLHDVFAAGKPAPAVSKRNKNGTALQLDWITGIELPITLDMRKPITIEGIVTRDLVLHAVHSNPFHAGAALGNIHVNINRYSGSAAAIQTQNSGFSSTPQSRVEFDRPVHLAMVLDGKEMRFFQDGKLVGTVTGVPFATPDRAGCVINEGANPWSVSRFVGPVREVRFSSIARYDKDFTPVERHDADEHTVGLYRLDEGEGDVAHDSSGKNHHGRITNARWVREWKK